MKSKKHFFDQKDLSKLKVNQDLGASNLSNLIDSEEKLSGIIGGYNDSYPNYTESTFVNNINPPRWP